MHVDTFAVARNFVRLAIYVVDVVMIYALTALSLRELSHCIRQDGNDAVHDGSVGEDEAEDLQDFTSHLLENVYTTPKRLELAKDRRVGRRAKPA